jgi:hypothetical protein
MGLFGNSGILSGIVDGTVKPDGTTSYLGGLLTYNPASDIGPGDRLGLFGAALKDAAAQFSGHPEAANSLDRYSVMRRKQAGQQLLMDVLAGSGSQDKIGYTTQPLPPTALPSPMRSGPPMMVDRTLPALPDAGPAPAMGGAGTYDLKTLAPRLAMAAAAGADIGPVLDIIKLSQPKYNTTPQFTADGRGYLVGENGSVDWLDPSVTKPHKVLMGPNGVTYDPYTTRPGTTFNDPNKPFGIGSDGQPIPNVPYQTYDIGKTQAQQAPQWARLNFDRDKLAAGIPDEQTLHDMAVRYVNGDRMAAGAMGRNPRAQTAFQNMISQVGREQGLTPQQVSQNIQNFQAVSKAIQAFDTGKQGDTVRSLNVAVSHLETLRELGNALNNHNMTAWNSAKQKFAQVFGVPAPTNWDAAKSIVADEIAKSVIGGQSAQNDREALAATLRNSNSPSQIDGAISTFQNLLGGQLHGLRQQYENATGRKDFDNKLSRDTIAALERQSGSQQGNGRAGAAVHISNDADYDKLPSGTVFIGPDGQRRRKP